MREENKPLLVKKGTRKGLIYESSNLRPESSISVDGDSSLSPENQARQSRVSTDISEQPKEVSPAMPAPSRDEIQLTMWHRLTYYLPCFSWLPTYDATKFIGDLIAGASLASFQIPLAMSYSTSVAHVPPICGLNALAFTPLVYAVFGSVPHMIVGPESAISLVVGQAIEKLTKHDASLNVTNLCVVLTFISGSILFSFGLMRFGFLDSVLSRALLRGFISAVGLIMVINSLISELKLKDTFKNAPGHYHAPFQKVVFLVHYAPANYHLPTALVSLVCFAALGALKVIKKKLVKRFKKVIFFPDILVVVAFATLVSYCYDFKVRYNIDIVGDIETGSSNTIKNPISKDNLKLFNDLFHAGFLVALLGFFESTTASKSLGTNYDLAISSNRELVALGSLNLVGSLFGALPSFGGYGRSKINAYSGAATVMSGVFMGLITLITSKFLLNAIRHIPICVLSVITTMVGISLFEEAPADLKFHFRCRGYNELLTFAITVLTTFFYSVEAGITLGCGYSIIRAIKNSTQSGIQILGRISGTNRFVNADEFYSASSLDSEFGPRLDHMEGCLVARIAEPLTFTNTEDLKSRLNRLENHGSVKTHPASPRSRDKDLTRNMIFDLEGMTQIDSSASQILCEIVKSLTKRKVRVYLARVPRALHVRERLVASGVAGMVENNIPLNTASMGQPGDSWCFKSIQEALKMCDELAPNMDSEVSSECTSLSGTFVHSCAV